MHTYMTAHLKTVLCMRRLPIFAYSHSHKIITDALSAMMARSGPSKERFHQPASHTHRILVVISPALLKLLARNGIHKAHTI